MSNERAVSQQIIVEFERLGLDRDQSPYQIFSGEPSEVLRFLEGLRCMQPGVTWRDVFPEMPEHWVPGRPETWTTPYRPLGPYDYQELPTGPAVHVAWPKDAERGCLASLLSAARDGGWPVYGGGFIEITNPEWLTLDAMLILNRSTSEETLGAFTLWLEAQGIDLLAITRGVGEE